MSLLIKKMLGEGPYPFPIEDINLGQIVDACIGAGMITIAPKTFMDLPEGTHCHESYEFLIPYTPLPNVRLERRIISLEKNMLFPFNPEQFHGPATPVPGTKLLGLQIDSEFIHETSRMMGGKGNVSFKSEGIVFDRDMQELLRLFMEESKNRQSGYEFILQNIRNHIIIKLLRQMKSNMSLTITECNYNEKRNIDRAIEYLHAQYSRDYSLDDVAREANLSPYHFIRVFKAQTGKTPYDYLLDIKVEKAREMLRHTSKSITDICFLCGFHSLEHFSSVFKRKIGVLPSQYRKIFI